MGSPPVSSDISFPPADIDGELDTASGNNVHLQVDPESSELAAKKNSRERAKAKEEKKEEKKKDALQTLKSAIIVSGIIVAVAGVAFAVTKKLREK
ncbi:hypothetical protein LR48_Vigan03g244100 [Vigna angularis]|uniref:Transmembrane protein n=2 Tax=Phaseolus angularis TaxID=3914 RepID=A0A0L9U983_PHAAN|nr:uncharacterized protein HKW66_Vig0054610 [Vigna angularis]KOM39059.1 hypothetical protein LR48_Vigan03g244100 [Vigna angularis]BAT85876.1 hypothetical protein VIGAN_04347300 [Vigna angularis var. angularis]